MDDYWAYGYPYVTLLGGREYLTGGGRLAPPRRDTRFRELDTGLETVLDHPPGWVQCFGNPVWCTVNHEGQVDLLVGIDVQPGATLWRPEGTRRLATSDSPINALGPVGQDRVALWIGDAVEVLDVETGARVANVPLEGRRVMAIVRAPSPAQGKLLAHRHDETSVRIDSIDVLSDGAWEPVYSGPAAPLLALPIAAEDGWYVLRDGGLGDRQSTALYRSDAESTELLGSSSDPALRAIDLAYYYGSRPLERGPSAFALTCNDECSSFLVRFEPFTIEAVGSATVPDSAPFQILSTRWLSCGAADVVVRAEDGPYESGAPVRLWSVRVPGRRGVP